MPVIVVRELPGREFLSGEEVLQRMQADPEYLAHPDADKIFAYLKKHMEMQFEIDNRIKCSIAVHIRRRIGCYSGEKWWPEGALYVPVGCVESNLLVTSLLPPCMCPDSQEAQIPAFLEYLCTIQPSAFSPSMISFVEQHPDADYKVAIGMLICIYEAFEIISDAMESHAAKATVDGLTEEMAKSLAI